MSKRNKLETTATLELGQAQAMIAGDQEVFNEWLAKHKGRRSQLRKMLFDTLMVAKLYHNNQGRLEGCINDQEQERQRLLEASRQMEDAYNQQQSQIDYQAQQIDALLHAMECQARAAESALIFADAITAATRVGIVFGSKD